MFSDDVESFKKYCEAISAITNSIHCLTECDESFINKGVALVACYRCLLKRNVAGRALLAKLDIELNKVDSLAEKWLESVSNEGSKKHDTYSKLVVMDAVSKTISYLSCRDDIAKCEDFLKCCKNLLRTSQTLRFEGDLKSHTKFLTDSIKIKSLLRKAKAESDRVVCCIKNSRSISMVCYLQIGFDCDAGSDQELDLY